MASTLLPGDVLVADSWAERGFVGLGVQGMSPATGEVWVFAAPMGVERFQVKRVIGLPGDTISMHEGSVRLNGLPLAEPYLRDGTLTGTRTVDFTWQRRHLLPGADTSDYHPSSTTWGPLVVPDSSYFVLGDNRVVGIDSRHQGFVRLDQFRGRAKGIFFSYGASEQETFPADQAIRWNRIGRLGSGKRVRARSTAAEPARPSSYRQYSVEPALFTSGLEAR